MLQKVEPIIADIRSVKNVEAYIVIFVTFVIVALDLFGVVNISILSELLFAVLGILLYMNLKTYRMIEESRSASSDISKSCLYLRKEELPTREDSLLKAKKEYCVLAIHATSLLHFSGALFRSKLVAGCKVRILIMARDVDGGKTNPYISHFEGLTKHPAVAEDLVASIKFVRHWLENLDDVERRNIEVRCYLTFPSALYLTVDKQRASGYAIVEPILPYLRTHERPAFKVHHSDDEMLFKALSDSFDEIWENSRMLL